MYLGIINGWEEGHFKAVSEKGLKGIEFCINYNRDSAEALAKAADIKGYSEKYGVKVGSIGRWGMERMDENSSIIPEALQHDKNLIDLASIVGCPVYNVGFNRIDGMDYYENCQKAIEYFSGLIEYARPKAPPSPRPCPTYPSATRTRKAPSRRPQPAPPASSSATRPHPSPREAAGSG